MNCRLSGFSAHGFLRQKYWSGLPLPSPEYLPYPGIGRQILYHWAIREAPWRFLKKLKIEIPYNPAIPLLGIHLEKKKTNSKRQVVLRWQRNRTGRSLSPPQIHQKNIWTLSKFHKTTSECRQRTSGTQKSGPLSSKGGRKKYKRQKERQKR